MGYEQKRFLANQKIIKNTLEALEKQNPYSISPNEGLTLINNEFLLFNQFDINELLIKFSTAILEKKEYKDYKWIFFLSRNINEKPIPKTKVINFFSALHSSPEIKLSIQSINALDPKFPALVLEDFLKSIYFDNNTESIIHYCCFSDITHIIKNKNITDIKKILEIIEQNHKKKKIESNFDYLCSKYKVEQYFSKESKLPEILDQNNRIIFKIQDGFGRDPIYPSTLCLLVYFILIYLKNKHQRVIIVLDDIYPFISLQTYSNEFFLSDIFKTMFNSLNGTSFSDINNKEYFHKPLLVLTTNNLDRLGKKDRDIARNLREILSINPKMIFNFDGYFLHLAQKYIKYPSDYIYNLINLGGKVYDFNQAIENEKLPFLIGDYDVHNLSDKVNLQIIPIDFKKYELNIDLLIKITEIENSHIEFKNSFTNETKPKIIKNIMQFLQNKKGGNILLGVDSTNTPVGIDFTNNYSNPGKMIEAIEQAIVDNINPRPEDSLFDVRHFFVSGKNYITITIWSSNKKYHNKQGNSSKRYGSISRPE